MSWWTQSEEVTIMACMGSTRALVRYQALVVRMIDFGDLVRNLSPWSLSTIMLLWHSFLLLLLLLSPSTRFSSVNAALLLKHYLCDSPVRCHRFSIARYQLVPTEGTLVGTRVSRHHITTVCGSWADVDDKLHTSILLMGRQRTNAAGLLTLNICVTVTITFPFQWTLAILRFLLDFRVTATRGHPYKLRSMVSRLSQMMLQKCSKNAYTGLPWGCPVAYIYRKLSSSWC